MDGYIGRTVKSADQSEAALVRLRPWRWIRITLTAASVLLFLLAALLDERPQLMLVGLAPLTLIAAEAVWHLLGRSGPDEPGNE
jgi:DMSO reductase anchor subunit